MTAVDRSRLPALGPEPTFTFPEIRRSVLANGLRVWTVEHRDVPVINALLLLPAGAADDPADQPGLAAITGDLLDEGSGDLSALEFHEALGRLGASLDTEVGSDATLLGADHAGAVRRARPGAAGRPRDAARASTPREFDRVRELRLNRLTQLRDVPSAVAERVFVRAALRRPSLRPPGDRHGGLARRRSPSTTSSGSTTRATIPASPR